MKYFKYWMPCFVSLRPNGLVRRDEVLIYYWFPDGYEEYWAIVPVERVFTSFIIGAFGTCLNPELFPALLLIERIEFPIKNHSRIFLDDLDQKWVQTHWWEDTFYIFTQREAKNKLNNSLWVRERFTKFAERLPLREPSDRSPILNMQTGFIE